MTSTRKGILIAIEGIDGAGKTTQRQRIAEAMQARGFEVIITKEPTNGPHGQRIRQSAITGRMSPEDELQAFLDDRQEHVDTLINPSLEAGKAVIVDRYYFSTIAYQGAVGLDTTMLQEVNEAFAPVPDVLVILDIDPRVGLGRVASRGDDADLFENIDNLTKSRAIFNQLKGDYILRIDATLGVDTVTDTITKRIDAILSSR